MNCLGIGQLGYARGRTPGGLDTDATAFGAVEFLARDPGALGNGFEMTAGSTLVVTISRTAGVYSGT